jgi:UDP-N-acetylmuramate--alanine ligase
MQIDLTKINHVHFIGIGGIGVSAIARMMLGEGKVVSGQDVSETDIIRDLVDLGADIVLGQSIENIPKDADLIVYTIAIEYYDEVFFSKLKSLDIKSLSYPQMLGEISKGQYAIAVTGTHGKTTTTGMISQIFRDLDRDPTVVIGSLLSDGTNFVHGKSGIFISESCEYRRSFLNMNPKILVITNIDEDHLDYYKDIEDIKSAFRELAMKVPEDGFVVCNPNDKNISDVISDIKATIVDYQDFYDNDLKLKIPGIHNKKNAAAAVAVATILDITEEDAKNTVINFAGTWRRFQYKGKLDSGALIYDDYAHHPTEIMASLQGFRELYPETEGYRLTIIFQPHLYSRTKSLLADFAHSFVQADNVLFLPIYAAREVDDGTISSKILSIEVNKHKNNSASFPDFDSAYDTVSMMGLHDKDVIVTLGAGDALKIGDRLLA